MAEHTFGVRKVAFSPCSRYLASIGTINESVIHLDNFSDCANSRAVDSSIYGRCRMEKI